MAADGRFGSKLFVKAQHPSQMLRMYGIFTYMKGEKWLHSRVNVGKYSLHGAFGHGFESYKWPKINGFSWGEITLLTLSFSG